jgi:hypothetical protein
MNESVRSAPRHPRERALTVRSGAASVLVVALSGVVLTLAGVFDAGTGVSLMGSEALPIPVYLVLVPLMFSIALVAAVAKTRLLSRAELFAVMLAATVAAPLMGMGFYRYQLAGLATVVRTADFIKLEALPEGLWPHGENLFAGPLTEASGARAIASDSGSARLTRDGALLSNPTADGKSALRVRVALGEELASNEAGETPVAVPGRPYLFTALVRAEKLAPGAAHFVRVYADDAAHFSLEVASGRQEKKASTLRPDGFVRVGGYAIPLPREAKRFVDFELGLEGAGTAEWRDLRLYDVRAIEAAFRGYSRVSADEYARLELAERQTALVVPETLWSRAGVRYLLGLDYPIRDWIAPIARLGVFVLLVLGVTFGLALIYRKQWLENERYPLPMARIPLVLLGAGESLGGLGERFYKHRFVWLGFAIGLPWCAIQVARGYYPNLPDLAFSVGLKGYFTDPNFGRTWDTVEFKLYVTFFSLALLMELHVLLSLVVGFFLLRFQYWFGEVQGLTTDQDFPYFGYQLLGGYLAYAALVVIFTRRYLGEALLAALGRGTKPEDVAGRRAGLALVVLGLVGFSAWGVWLGMPLHGVLLLAVHVVVLGFVGAKLRAECGMPFGAFNHAQGGPGSYSVPIEALLFVPILGGMPAFGGTSVMVLTLVSATILPFAFFNLPGVQVEFLEVGRRLGIRTREVGLTLLLGFVLAIVIGAFLYFFALYGFGASRLPGVSDFTERIGGFRIFNAEVASSEAALEAAARGGSAAGEGQKNGPYVAMAFGGSVASAITILRQFFPGFWFHPIGFLAGASEMTRDLWGSLLVAYLVRLAVLRLGGAATVREKLVPAAVGLFLAALLGHAAFILVNALYFFFNLGLVKFSGFL